VDVACNSLWANMANESLKRAIDLDEKRKTTTIAMKTVIDAYTSAAEAYLRAIRFAEQEQEEEKSAKESPTAKSNKNNNSSNANMEVLKSRLSSALDRVEALKISSRIKL